MSKTLLVAGSRDYEGPMYWDTFDQLSYVLDMPFDVIIHGGARGIDTEAGRWAESKGKEVIVYPADWKTYGKRAGYIRNAEMSYQCHAAILVWNGYSKGTKNMMDILLERKLPFALAVL
jgi:hypothetical protein